MSKFVILLTAAVFFLYGIGFAVIPQEMSILVTGGFPGTESGIIDMRSTYGGMSIAVGVFLWFLARKPETHSLGLQAVAVIMGAMASARILGFVLDGSPNWVMWAFLVAELTALLVSVWQVRIEGKS